MPDSVRRTVARSTLLTALFTALWMAVVYATQVVLAAWFGTGKEMDAYLAATSVPMFISTLTVESLNLAFVPVFIEHQLRGDEQAAWRVTSIVLSSLIFALTLTSAAGVLFSPLLMRVIVPGFDPPRYALATTMSQIIFPSTLFTAVAGFLTSIHYAQKKFLIPALSPLVAAIVNLGLILALVGNLGIVASAWGSFWAPLASCVLAAPILRGHPLRFDLNWRDAGVREITRLAGWRVLGDGLGKATPIVDRFIASSLAVGAISYLGYGTRILGFALGLVSQSISTVLFPLLSERAAGEDLASLSRAVSVGMRMTALVTLPVSAILLVLREPIVRVLFARGRFDASATEGVALVLLGYFGILATNSLAGQIVPTLYALKQARMVALVSMLGTAVYVVSAFALTPHLNFLGLALALSLNYLFNAACYTYVLFRRLHVQWDPMVTRFYVRSSLATILASAVAYWLYAVSVPSSDILSQLPFGRGMITDVLPLAFAGAGAMIVYLLALVLSRAPEIGLLWAAFRRRLGFLAM